MQDQGGVTITVGYKGYFSLEVTQVYEDGSLEVVGGYTGLQTTLPPGMNKDAHQGSPNWPDVP